MFRSGILHWVILTFSFVLVLALAQAQAQAQTQTQTQKVETNLPSAPPSSEQSTDDAWWTGPILAQSAATLPKGHFLIEPYFYDVISGGSHSVGSRAYVLYGLVDRFTVGVIPILGLNGLSSGSSSDVMGLGDVGVSTQFRITKFNKERWLPATAIQVQQYFPTGKYDRLGTRSTDGQGSGTYATTLSINTQKFFWIPNGRILRMRFNVSETLSSTASVRGVSVYGTPFGFRGNAEPGKSLFLNAAWEYSLTRNWVPALDVTYKHAGNTKVFGYDNGVPLSLDSGSSDGVSFTPAIEYNWTSNIGVIVGTRLIPNSHNTSASVTPVFAINIFH